MYCIGCGDQEPEGLTGVRFRHINYTLCGDCWFKHFYAALANKTRQCDACNETLIAESSHCRFCGANDLDWEPRVGSIIRKHIRSQQLTFLATCPTCEKTQKHALISHNGRNYLCVECGKMNTIYMRPKETLWTRISNRFGR